MVFYTSVETEFARALTGGFEAKYPFIKSDIFRLLAASINARCASPSALNDAE
ncbi:MAG: hypothetical protein ACREQV_19745 [Candidatus Binatia bacterium]